MAGYGLGVIESPGLFFYLGVTFITGVTTSIFVLFENRYFTLFGQNTFWRNWRKYVIGFSYTLVPLYFLPPQFVLPDQEQGREHWMGMLPCIPELPGDRDLFVLANKLPLVAICIGIAEGVPGIQCGVFLFLNCFHLIFAKKPSGISRKTVKLQHKLVISLIVQSSVSIVLFLAPVNAIILVVALEYQNQFQNNLIVFGLAIHGVASTIIMIVVHKPYRDFVLYPVTRFHERKKNPATIAVVSSIPSMKSTVE